jgi:hypothetical protein
MPHVAAFSGSGASEARWDGFRQSVRRQAGLLMMGPRHRFAGLLVFTTLQWLPRYGVLWFVLLELGYRLPFGFVVAVQAVVLHAALWTDTGWRCRRRLGACGSICKLDSARCHGVGSGSLALRDALFPADPRCRGLLCFCLAAGSVRPTTE